MNQERSEVLEAIEDVLDRYVTADIEQADANVAIFRLKFLANEINKPTISLYNYNTYHYLTTTYDSVTYLENKGKLKIDLNTWVKERELDIDQEQDNGE